MKGYPMNDVRKALYLGIWKMLCLLSGYSVRLNSGIRSGAALTQENLAASGLAGPGLEARAASESGFSLSEFSMGGYFMRILPLDGRLS